MKNKKLERIKWLKKQNHISPLYSSSFYATNQFLLSNVKALAQHKKTKTIRKEE